jgi:hypothetical protein
MSIWLAIAIGIIALWVVFAPSERVLAGDIRVVYLHVATTWAGMTGIYLAGLLGLALLITQRSQIETWLRSVGWVGLGLFVTGFFLSLVAANTSWGGILWTEPRVIASLHVTAVGFVVQAISVASANRRLKGVLWTLAAGFCAWSLQTAELYFHPEQPISASPSLSIRVAFYGLFVLMLAAGSLAVRLIHVANATAAHNPR